MEQQTVHEEESESLPNWFGTRPFVMPILLVFLASITVLNIDKIVTWEKGLFGNKNQSVQNIATTTAGKEDTADTTALEANVLPIAGFELPIIWKDYGKQLIAKGVIDQEKFEAIYANRGGLSAADKELLVGTDNGKMTITAQNSGVLLNLLWAFGLGNTNQILDKGQMTDPSYGGAGKFASTGGWSISDGNAMDHYSKHAFISLTADQQAMVKRVSDGIYRPCCNNPTSFPDCNHGMAMLGLLEIMAGQGVSESQMYTVALEVNSFWFPQTYLTLARYFEGKGTAWKDVDAKMVLGKEYSSAGGYQRILTEIDPVEQKKQGGAGCGV